MIRNLSKSCVEKLFGFLNTFTHFFRCYVIIKFHIKLKLILVHNNIVTNHKCVHFLTETVNFLIIFIIKKYLL